MRPLRLPTHDEGSRLFTAFVIGGGGVIGSAISFLFGGAILYVLLKLYQGTVALPKRREVLLVGGAFALYWFSITISSLLNHSGSRSLIKIVEALPFLAFLLLYGSLSISRRHDVLRAVEYGTIVGAFAALVFATIQIMLVGMPRAQGLAGNPGVFAVLTAVLYGMALLTAARYGGGLRKVALLAAAAAAAALLLSGMRGLWPVLILSPVAIALILRPSLEPRLIAKGVVVVAALAFLVAWLSYGIILQRMEMIASDYHEIVEEGDYSGSLGQRLRIWSTAMELGLEHPIFGHGQGNAPALMMERTARNGSPLGHTHFHNFILDAWVASGVFGVLALMLMLATPLWLAARSRRDEIGTAGLAMMALIVISYVVSGTFNIMLGHDILDALFIFAMITASFLVFGQSSTVATETGNAIPGRRIEHGPAPPADAASERLPATASAERVDTGRQPRRVAILMAVFNGEQYLKEQIDSLAAQDMSRIDLWISDDGSQDATPDIVGQAAREWDKGQVQMLQGPGQGFAENFRFLLIQEQVDADFVAFCDQDDLWEPDKLSDAIDWLETQDMSRPALFCSRTRLITAEGTPSGRSPLFARPPSFRNALVQSLAGGNTMVMNRAAHLVMAEACRRTSFVSHDWWSYLIVTGVGGTVRYSPHAKISYRQHHENIVGANNSWRARMFRLSQMLKGRLQRWNEANLDALGLCDDLLTDDAKNAMREFARARQGNAFSRLACLVRSGVYRQTRLGQIGLYIACIARRL